MHKAHNGTTTREVEEDRRPKAACTAASLCLSRSAFQNTAHFSVHTNGGRPTFALHALAAETCGEARGEARGERRCTTYVHR